MNLQNKYSRDEFLSLTLFDLRPPDEHERLAKILKDPTHFEEINLFPPPEALNDFFSDVDNLRMDAARLEARVVLLSKKIATRRVNSQYIKNIC